MSDDIYINEDVVLTRFCGPQGARRGYQLTSLDDNEHVILIVPDNDDDKRCKVCGAFVGSDGHCKNCACRVCGAGWVDDDYCTNGHPRAKQGDD